MLIPINERYRIAGDSRQWIIQESRTRNGAIEWQSKYYFGTIESAVKELGELMVRESKANTLVGCPRGTRKGYHHALPSLNTPF